MMLSFDTAYRSFGGEVEASSTPTICRLSDSCRHQLSAIAPDTVVGRIYCEMIIGKPKWQWFLQQIPEAGPGRPIPPPNQGMADTLEEAQAAFKKRYEEVKRGK